MQNRFTLIGFKILGVIGQVCLNVGIVLVLVPLPEPYRYTSNFIGQWLNGRQPEKIPIGFSERLSLWLKAWRDVELSSIMFCIPLLLIANIVWWLLWRYLTQRLLQTPKVEVQ